MREEIWTEKIFKDETGYYLRITKFNRYFALLIPHAPEIPRAIAPHYPYMYRIVVS